MRPPGFAATDLQQEQFDSVQQLAEQAVEDGHSFEDVFAEDNFAYDADTLAELQQEYLEAESDEVKKAGLLWGLTRAAAGTTPTDTATRGHTALSHKERARFKDE